MALASGARLGAYETVALIGAGGMGEFYRARDSRLRREVAIKVLPALVATDHDRQARFECEAQVLAALSHPHIATIFALEVGESVSPTGEARPLGRALVMELVEGPTDWIAQSPVLWRDALAIVRQIADGPEAAHEKGGLSVVRSVALLAPPSTKRREAETAALWALIAADS